MHTSMELKRLTTAATMRFAGPVGIVRARWGVFPSSAKGLSRGLCVSGQRSFLHQGPTLGLSARLAKNACPRPKRTNGVAALTQAGRKKYWFSDLGGRNSDKAEEQQGSTNQSDLGMIDRLGWGPKGLIADKNFNRYLMIPAATLNHLCLGSIFAWSIFNQPLMRLNGVVAPAAQDWALGDISVTFSLVMGGFAWGALFGSKLDQYGPRISCLIGATSLASGFLLASAAVTTQSLPLLYAGGLVWGVSNGWSYVPPVSALMRWFPDRKGLASGLCILGYGGGAMIAAPLFGALLEKFRRLPEYVGKADDLEFINESGRMFVETGSGLKEVVVATATDIQVSGLAQAADAGAYVVGTGSTGVAETLGILGLGYGATMAAASFAFRLPPSDYKPTGSSASASEIVSSTSKSGNSARGDKPEEEHRPPQVSAAHALKTPQFYILYAGFGASITGTYGLLSCGKLMVSEVFGSSLPAIVTAGFTSSFVAGMSAANLSGRLMWPTFSDYLASRWGGDPFFARKATFAGIWSVSPVLYLAIPASIHYCVDHPGSVAPLVVFCASVLGILNVFGGTTAGRPALVADLYGLKDMSVNTARQLSVVLPAAFLGPQLVAYFRQQSLESSIHKLAEETDPATFEHAFGAPRDTLPELIDSKAVTVSRLLEILPNHVQDPTPFAYDQAMYALAAINIAALASNALLKPIRIEK